MTTCAELLPRRYPRASDGQDALAFCPTERAISDRRQMDATTFSRQTRSLRLLFGSAVGRSELLQQNFLETSKLEARTKKKRQSAEHLRLDFLPDRNDRTPPQTPPAASPLSPLELSTGHERTAWSNSPHSSLLKRGLRQRRNQVHEAPVLRVGPPQEVEAILSFHFSSRPPCGTPHTRLPAQLGIFPWMTWQWAWVIFNKGKEACISRTTLRTAEVLLSFFLGQGLKVTVNSIEIQ